MSNYLYFVDVKKLLDETMTGMTGGITTSGSLGGQVPGKGIYYPAPMLFTTKYPMAWDEEDPAKKDPRKKSLKQYENP
jgi:hypothetical protein